MKNLLNKIFIKIKSAISKIKRREVCICHHDREASQVRYRTTKNGKIVRIQLSIPVDSFRDQAATIDTYIRSIIKHDPKGNGGDNNATKID